MKKLDSNGSRGFTLAELLVVVAVIAILTMIAIPVFSSHMERARETTDAANIRGLYGEVSVKALTEGAPYTTQKTPLLQKKEGWQNGEYEKTFVALADRVSGHPVPGGSAWLEYSSSDKTITLYYEGEGSSQEELPSAPPEEMPAEPEEPDAPVYESGSDVMTRGQDYPPKPAAGEYAHLVRGNLYLYDGAAYVCCSDSIATFSQHYYIVPDDSTTWAFTRFDAETRVLTAEDVNASNGQLKDLKKGDLFAGEDGSVYVRVYDAEWGLDPENDKNGSNWQKINLE